MRMVGNLLLALAVGTLLAVLSVVGLFGVLIVLSRGSAPGIGVGAGPIFVALIAWPIHLVIGLLGAATTFFVRQARDTRKAETELAQAFRDLQS